MDKLDKELKAIERQNIEPHIPTNLSVLSVLNYGVNIKNDDYPFNLMIVLGVVPAEDIEDFQKQVEGLNYILSSQSIDDKERKVIDYRFAKHLTLKESSEKLGVSAERVREIEAKILRKLRHPVRRHAVAYGLEQLNIIEDAKKEIEELNEKIFNLQSIYDDLMEKLKGYAIQDYIKVQNQAKITLEDIGDKLSTRAYNILKRAGFENLYDLNGKTRRQLLRIRNMGKTTLDEIVSVLEQYDIHIS